ncbi:hypothetical protein N658DRAFT_560148 [Parathielavia hyrcaniae]|uniref:Uncharacterized protein n=1 Tax=Parathielavia hyrcaniae TaxID=113614 RepID=A0AAN6PZ88_9PEZI|nr:hypothetical protein N658DRAFT_560148 [Parathielavia hyrcaniae]
MPTGGLRTRYLQSSRAALLKRPTPTHSASLQSTSLTLTGGQPERKRWTWSTVLVGWEDTMQRGIENEFARLESSSAQRCKSTAPRQMSTWGCFSTKSFQTIVSRTPSLHMHSSESSLVIEWDAADVNAEIERLKAEDLRKKLEEEAERRAWLEKKRIEKEARRERRYQLHRDLVARQQQRPSPLGLKHLSGLYLVEHSGDGDWDEYNDNNIMKLNVFPATSSHGVVASFCFGTIEGAMLLGMSRRDVEMLREKQLKHGPHYELWDSDDEVGSPQVPAASATRDKDVKDKLVGGKRAVEQMAVPWGVQARRGEAAEDDESLGAERRSP